MYNIAMWDGFEGTITAAIEDTLTSVIIISESLSDCDICASILVPL